MKLSMGRKLGRYMAQFQNRAMFMREAMRSFEQLSKVTKLNPKNKMKGYWKGIYDRKDWDDAKKEAARKAAEDLIVAHQDQVIDEAGNKGEMPANYWDRNLGDIIRG